MNHSPSGSFAHRILQARILEWVAICFSFSNWTTTIIRIRIGQAFEQLLLCLQYLFSAKILWVVSVEKGTGQGRKFHFLWNFNGHWTVLHALNTASLPLLIIVVILLQCGIIWLIPVFPYRVFASAEEGSGLFFHLTQYLPHSKHWTNVCLMTAWMKRGRKKQR